MLPLLTDLSHALRELRKSPALAAIAVSSLALGIGANVTIYSIVREMILDDLSARHPGRLARIAAEIPYPRYRELRQAGVFQDLAFNLWLTDINWNSGTHGEIVWQMITSANFANAEDVEEIGTRNRLADDHECQFLRRPRRWRVGRPTLF